VGSSPPNPLATPSQPSANPQATPYEVYQDDGEKKELKQLA